MNKIDDAIGRLGAALTRLEQALADGVAPQAAEDGALQTEHARLAAEVQVLRGRAADDARLRTDAAGAVREALRDLRGAVARQGGGEGRANA